MNKLTYISVPLWQGAEKRGIEQAPKTFWENGVQPILRTFFDVEQIVLPHLTEELSSSNKYALFADYLKQLKQAVLTTFAQGSLPFIVGGDHALGLGSVAAVTERYDNAGVIWFDAHGDMNTEQTSPTGHIHGMPLAAAMGLCESELNDVATKRIKPENIFWVGTRSLDAGEQALIEKLHLHVYTTEYVRSVGMKQVLAEIRAELQHLQISHLHCSIDIDAMDPTIVQATGVAEPEGLNNEDYETFVEGLPLLPVQLTSIDFVEYNPLLDDTKQSSLTWCLDAINKLMKAISE